MSAILLVAVCCTAASAENHRERRFVNNAQYGLPGNLVPVPTLNGGDVFYGNGGNFLSGITLAQVAVWIAVILVVVYVLSLLYPGVLHGITARNIQDFSTNVMDALQDDNLQRILKNITNK